MHKSIWIAALAFSVLAVPRLAGNAQKSKDVFTSADKGFIATMPTGFSPDLEVRFTAPTTKDGRKFYSLDVKADWTCVGTSGGSAGVGANIVTITCIKADPPAAK